MVWGKIARQPNSPMVDICISSHSLHELISDSAHSSTEPHPSCCAIVGEKS